MGDILIRLRANVATGERQIVVDYESDPDRTPLEHEERHREIVELLVRDGVITRDQARQVVFEERAPAAGEPERAREGQA